MKLTIMLDTKKTNSTGSLQYTIHTCRRDVHWVVLRKLASSLTVGCHTILWGPQSLERKETGKKGSPPLTILLVKKTIQKTRMNDLSCCIRMWAQLPFVLSQSTLLTEGWTDSQTESLGNTVWCALHYVKLHCKNGYW